MSDFDKVMLFFAILLGLPMLLAQIVIRLACRPRVIRYDKPDVEKGELVTLANGDKAAVVAGVHWCCPNCGLPQKDGGLERAKYVVVTPPRKIRCRQCKKKFGWVDADSLKD